MIRQSVLLLGLILMAAPAVAFADWDPGMDSKWIQMPDETTAGIDVNASGDFILADDFECHQPGEITDIHIWGSWMFESLPAGGAEDVVFTLSIHADIPAEQSPTGYSMPGDVLWYRTFQPGEFSARIWLYGVLEGWLDPPGGYIAGTDITIWQYNFSIPGDERFYQEGTPNEPVVYWLDVKAEPVGGGAEFGWKTSVEHWNDDAVWVQGTEPYAGDWGELRYPVGHEYAGESIDLAFVIVGSGQDLDWGDAPDGPYPTLAVNNGAYHVIGGPNLGPLSDFPDPETDGQPDPNAFGDNINGSDDENGVQIPTLMQGSTSIIMIAVSHGGMGAGGWVNGWIDFDGDGSWTAAEQVFDGWMPSGTWPIYVTTPSTAVLGQTFARFRINTNAALPPDGPAPDGEVEDHQVQIVEAQAYKWEQLPDLNETGIDIEATEPFILADDYLCSETGRITEIWVWGSWLDDYMPMGNPFAVDFTLSFHEDIPASENPDGYSIPGQIYWHRDFIAGDFDVRVYAQDLYEGWMTPPDDYMPSGDTVCWLYKFYVPAGEAFFQWGTPENPVIFWLDVQAHPHEPGALFGWKTARDHWNDDAVWIQGFEPYFGPWFELLYPPAHPYAGQSIDLAFRLVNDPMSGVPERDEAGRFALYRIEPNPFARSTTIRYSLASSGPVRLEVFNVMGQVVSTLVDADRPAGPHATAWSGVDDEGHGLPAGIYFCRLSAGRERAAQKMLFLK